MSLVTKKTSHTIQAYCQCRHIAVSYTHLISSVFSVLAFNYFFTVPYFTLKAYSDDYPVTFLTMFLTAFITSTLAVRMKQQTKDASEAAYRTHILLETNQLIQQQDVYKRQGSGRAVRRCR